MNAINFYGFKVLQLKKDPDTTWHKAYTTLMRAFLAYLDSNKDALTSYSGQDSSENFFPSQLGKAEQAYRNPGGPVSTDAVEAKKAGGNLFAEIQEKTLGMSLKHVEKNAHKKEGAAAALGEVPKKPVAAKVVEAPTKEVAKKPPKKELQGNQWYIENYGKEVLKFEGDDVQPNYGFALIKCQDTTLVVDGKCKTLLLENCSNIKIVCSSILASIEILNSKKITVTIKEICPQVNIERCQGIHLYLFPSAKACKVHSTCSQSMVVHYPREGAGEEDEWLDIAIPETNVTQIKNDKLVSEALEGME
jgi:adenylyl cyclase-associated protein